MKAADFARAAAEMVSGDRADQHGSMDRNFKNIAALWNAYLAIRRDAAAPISSEDVGHLMALLKVARTQTGSRNNDDITDGIGYLACAGQIGTESDAA